MKRCYYEILEVDKKVASSEIKIAYRKMALKYHPDKNPTEEGKKLFLEVQQAYDVLSDPNERTFYDNNREKILFNKDQMSKQDLQQYSFGFNIWEFFTIRCFKGYGDDQEGFFTVYRNVFQKIKAEEQKAYKSRDDLEQQMRKYEGFGQGKTNINKVLAFYNDWQNFTTYKSFIWTQQYDLRDAENRWVKRRMQQQNKKQRQKQKKSYIKTIKDLVNFVKKRDIRFQQYIIHMRQQQQRKQKQKIEKLQEKKKEKQEMKKVKQQLEEERFKEIQEYHKLNNNHDINDQHIYQDDQLPDFYCQICDKTFKSQNQLLNHEKSKIHKQNIKILQKQVMLPGQNIQQRLKEQDEINQNVLNQPAAKKKKRRKKKNMNNTNQLNIDEDQDEKDNIEEQILKQTIKKKQPSQNTQFNHENVNGKKHEDQDSEESIKEQKGKNKNVSTQKNQKKLKQKPQKMKKPENQEQNDDDNDDDDDDDFFLMSLAQNRNKKHLNDENSGEQKNKNKKGGKNHIKLQNKQRKKNHQNKNADQSKSEGEAEEQKKIGKAKLKKMKKAEQEKDNTLKCKTCSLVFTSKTKLFDHLKQAGHAAFKV